MSKFFALLKQAPVITRGQDPLLTSAAIFALPQLHVVGVRIHAEVCAVGADATPNLDLGPIGVEIALNSPCLEPARHDPSLAAISLILVPQHHVAPIGACAEVPALARDASLHDDVIPILLSGRVRRKPPLLPAAIVPLAPKVNVEAVGINIEEGALGRAINASINLHRSQIRSALNNLLFVEAEVARLAIVLNQGGATLAMRVTECPWRGVIAVRQRGKVDAEALDAGNRRQQIPVIAGQPLRALGWGHATKTTCCRSCDNRQEAECASHSFGKNRQRGDASARAIATGSRAGNAA